MTRHLSQYLSRTRTVEERQIQPALTIVSPINVETNRFRDEVEAGGVLVGQ